MRPTIFLLFVVYFLTVTAPLNAGWLFKSDTEKTQEAFSQVLDKSKQSILEQYHLLATAKRVVVERFALSDAKGNETSSLKNAVGFGSIYTIYWTSSLRTDGFLKLWLAYDFTSQRIVDARVVETNGVLNEDAAQIAGEFLRELFESQ